MTNISLLNLRVVKEKSGRYEVEKYIKNPEDIKNIAIKVLELNSQPEEIFAIITLDTKNKITGIFEVSRGTLNSSVVHPREVFKRAILQNSNSIVLLHNHPSGDIIPSQEDINVTNKIIQAGEILGINVLDHIIIGDNEHSFLSFKEKAII